MLDLRRLTTFREVVSRRSFSAAAQALDYTQSSVSQQITTLERELGVTLIDRASRPVTATAIGEAVMTHAEALLGQATSIERELGALSRGESGTLRVGGFFTAWTTFMPAAIADFSRSHPRVVLELHQMEPEIATRAIGAGELDLAVVYRLEDSDADDDTLDSVHLLDDPYAIALPSAHPLARHEQVALRELAGERWVSPPPHDDYARVLIELCREHGGFAPQVTYETADIAMAQPIVASGLAVALLPALGLIPTHKDVTVRPLASTPPARSVWAIRPTNRAPATDAMTQALTQSSKRA
jgi:DNA-binding transcriptional LysR family regulator